MRSHNLPLGSGARHFHFTRSNSPTKLMTLDLLASTAFCSKTSQPMPALQCESKKSPRGFVAIFPKQLGIFLTNFTCLLRVPIYAWLRIFIQLSATLTKLCHIKRDHPVHIMCAKCPPSAETHTFSDIFPTQLGIFSPNFTHLLSVHIYARIQIFIKLSQTVTKLCHIKCDHPVCVSVDGGHFEHIMVVALKMA